MMVLFRTGPPEHKTGKTFLGTDVTDVYSGCLDQLSWQRLSSLSSDSFVMGYISYDQGQVPGFWFGLFSHILVKDHRTGQVQKWFSHGRKQSAPWPRLRAGDFSLGRFGFDQSREHYIEVLNTIKSEIRDGHYYQINYTIRAVAEFKGDPMGLFKAFTQRQPVAYSAFVDTGSGVLVSGSPELFLRIEANSAVSEPMKGTLSAELEPDQLLNSQKNRAENLMITDLVRHDLGKVSQKVDVEALFKVRSYSTVHQMVSVVKGHLRPGVKPVDVIEACFPPGSVTGAPKSSATQAIARLESSPRGAYTGIIGMITPWNTGVFSVAIRTAQIVQDRLIYGTGGGITFASDPESEWEECMLKIEAIKGL